MLPKHSTSRQFHVPDASQPPVILVWTRGGCREEVCPSLERNSRVDTNIATASSVIWEHFLGTVEARKINDITKLTFGMRAKVGKLAWQEIVEKLGAKCVQKPCDLFPAA
jgi:hypothetical protein